jgi:predicted dehydrogenase
MAKKLKVAIIGCGGIANGKHLPALAKKTDVLELAAFCDIIPERAAKAKTEYGTEESLVLTDYKELLDNASIDVVHVCTPNDSHAEIAIAFLEAGKHVMSEKPMAKTAASAREMLAASERTGKLLTVGYNNRFRPDSLYLKELCQQGELGEIYYAKAHALRRRAVPTWGVFLDEEKQGGGPLIDIGTHALDLTLWMMNNYEPKVVLGSTYRKLADNVNSANAWGPWDPKQFTVEDSAFGMITFKNGATVLLESSWAINLRKFEEAKVTLVGTKAGADMDGGLFINGEKNSRLYTQEIELKSGGVAFYEGKSENNVDVEMRVWYDAILNGSPLTVTPKQALVVSEILEAIYESAKNGKAISFE